MSASAIGFFSSLLVLLSQKVAAD